MKDSEKGLLFLIMAASMIVALIMGFLVGQAFCQTPPVSSIQALPDTVTTLEIDLHFSVQSSLPWDQGGGVGVYYRVPGVADWLYVGGGYESPIQFTIPVDNRGIEFASQVEDNAGNRETYPHDRPEPQAEVAAFVCTSCFIPENEDCPPTSPLQALQILAAAGFDMEADTPKLRWWWTHPTTGTQVVEYLADWEVDGTVAVISGIAVGDSTFAFWDAPYTVGQTQRIRVWGRDAHDRDGPKAVWSDPFTDDGPPGAPSSANSTLIMVD
jgi:hypothetical protein